jgi:hypothetical protein
MGSMQERRRIAVHEAAHAVIARVLTLVCGGASICADSDSAGHSINADPWACIYAWETRGKIRGSENAIWHARIMAFMAGAEAEIAVFGSTPGGDGDDRYQIDLMAEQIAVPTPDWVRLETRLRSMTRALIQRHRTRIELLAEQLLIADSLSGEAVDKLVGRSVDDVQVNAPWLKQMADHL